ncbi:Uncharacterized protein GBIM_01784 [Gryllus bimaculatus]|nr:Uncharacterized protein GBIM_01784 [Gryllus bimaculatus]
MMDEYPRRRNGSIGSTHDDDDDDIDRQRQRSSSASASTEVQCARGVAARGAACPSASSPSPPSLLSGPRDAARAALLLLLRCWRLALAAAGETARRRAPPPLADEVLARGRAHRPSGPPCRPPPPFASRPRSPAPRPPTMSPRTACWKRLPRPPATSRPLRRPPPHGPTRRRHASPRFPPDVETQHLARRQLHRRDRPQPGGGGGGPYADANVLQSEYLLHASVFSMVEFDDDIFAAGNCYDKYQYKDYWLFCPYAYRLPEGPILVKDLAVEYKYLSNTSEWFFIARKNAERVIAEHKHFSRGPVPVFQ